MRGRARAQLSERKRTVDSSGPPYPFSTPNVVSSPTSTPPGSWWGHPGSPDVQPWIWQGGLGRYQSCPCWHSLQCLSEYLLHILGVIPDLTGDVDPAVSLSPMQTVSMWLIMSLPLARKAGSYHLKGNLNFPELGVQAKDRASRTSKPEGSNLLPIEKKEKCHGRWGSFSFFCLISAQKSALSWWHLRFVDSNVMGIDKTLPSMSLFLS